MGKYNKYHETLDIDCGCNVTLREAYHQVILKNSFNSNLLFISIE